MESDAFVLYADHVGHLAPLMECYHATASRHLSASVDSNQPPPTKDRWYSASTLTQVDSAYCPQCLQFQDTNSLRTSETGGCPRATCALCPLCTARLSIVQDADYSSDKTLLLYQCLACQWKSSSLSPPLVSTTTGEDLGAELQQRRKSRQESSTAYFEHLLAYYDAMKQERERQRKQRKPLFGQVKADSVEGAVETTVDPLQESGVERWSPKDDDTTADSADDASKDAVSPLPVLLQAWNTSSRSETATSAQDLLPLPIALRVRTRRRCTLQFWELQRPGILLQPKLNPLEGDSSLRTGHGQWWKKDSSAVHIIPRVRVLDIVQKEVQPTKLALSFLIKVTNPSLGMMRLRFVPSAFLLDEGSGGPQEENPERQGGKPVLFRNLLVDSLSQTYQHVQVDTAALQSLTPTPTLELDSHEDAVLQQLGGGSERGTADASSKSQQSYLPQEVRNWKETAATKVSDMQPEQPPSMRLLVQRGCTAWYELGLVVSVSGDDKAEDAKSHAVTLALQIQVGDGSWQSSLIQPEEKEGGDSIDWVTLDMAIGWKRKKDGEQE